MTPPEPPHPQAKALFGEAPGRDHLDVAPTTAQWKCGAREDGSAVVLDLTSPIAYRGGVLPRTVSRTRTIPAARSAAQDDEVARLVGAAAEGNSRAWDALVSRYVALL